VLGSTAVRGSEEGVGEPGGAGVEREASPRAPEQNAPGVNHVLPKDRDKKVVSLDGKNQRGVDHIKESNA